MQPQSVDAPLSQSAVFLTVRVKPEPDAQKKAIATVAGIGDLIKDVGFRDLSAHVSCNVGIGNAFWGALGVDGRPSELRDFTEIVGPKHTAVATGGDLFFHIRSERDDLTYEMERLVLESLGDSVEVMDEVKGFRYFDNRDLLGFVDGTANPTGLHLPESTLVGDEDPDFRGGSYLVVQKYVHLLDAWEKLTTEHQEAIIGRRKADNVELPDNDANPAHKTLTTVHDEQGVERDILRDNMPFAKPGISEYGTFFIGYTRRLWVLEKMLERMFVGVGPDKYDKLLDFSTAKTGATFFVPTREFLDSLGD